MIWLYHSPVGVLELEAERNCITGLRFIETETVSGEEEVPDPLPVVTEAVRWLDAYFRGEDPGVIPRVAPAGTHFQRLVWEILSEIPYGERRTYGELAKEAARRMGKERMSGQAVGNALHRNPIAILLPCHRVLGAGDRLGGYGGGLPRKRWLLANEGISWKE